MKKEEQPSEKMRETTMNGKLVNLINRFGNFEVFLFIIIILKNIRYFKYSTAQRHCPLSRRSELTRALIVNI